MSDDSENGHSRDGIDIRTPSVHIRIEDLGTSSNPIVLDASPIVSRPSSEAPRGRGNPCVRSSRRKCPLGAYVEIIDEPISPRTQTTVTNNPTIATTMSMQRSSNEPADVEVAVEHGMDTTEECGPFLQVPASFEILMRCSICMEIFHNPANVSPCNHKFCHSCLLSWKRTNQTAVCPQCRGPIHSMQKDAQFNEVVQSFLLANPSKRRSPSELESLDAMDTECTEFQNGNQRGRRRGSVPQTRNRSLRDRTVRTPLLVRVSQIRAHRPVQRQRGNRGILEDWFNI